MQNAPKPPLPTVVYAGVIDRTVLGTEDWHVDDGYENNTYIDWMKESSVRESRPSFSKKWTILVLTALAVGYVAVFIDLASVWLNDLKKGLCFSKLEKWSLLNPYLTCPADDWYDWLAIFAGKDTALSLILFDFPLYLLFVALFVLVAAFITTTRAPLVKQSGIPEMKLIIAGFNYYMDSYLGPLTFFYKICALVLVVSSGFWLGKEGPLVHIACCILTIFFEYFYGKTALQGLKRELLSAAVATGIAVAFNSPIGGVLFVAELLPSYFAPVKIMWNSFVSATIALVALYGLKAFTDGKNYHDEALFEVLFGNFSWLFMETIPFIFLGLLGGFYGFAYTRTYLKFSDQPMKARLRRKLAALFRTSEKNGVYVEILVVAVTTACLTFPLSMTKMPLSAYLTLLFTDCPVDSELGNTNSSNFMCGSSSLSTTFKLGYIFVQGFVLSSYCYGLPLPGGILMPSFALGGTVGRIVGIVSQAIQNRFDSSIFSTCTSKTCMVSPSSYAVVGAAAFVTGITKLTLSVVVIIFELTGAVTYVLPIMIAVMTAKFFNDYICEENIYDAWLSHEFNAPDANSSAQLNLNKGDGVCSFSNISARFRARLPDTPVESVMVPMEKTRHFYLFPREPYSLTALYGFLSDDNHEGYPLLESEENPLHIGYLTKKNVYRLILREMGNVQNTGTLLVFQIRGTASLAEEQKAYQRQITEKFDSVYFVPVIYDSPKIIAKRGAFLKQIIEIFERLSLNYLVIDDEKGRGSGFIDRFNLARLIHLGFSQLQSTPREFDISDSEEENFGLQR